MSYMQCSDNLLMTIVPKVADGTPSYLFRQFVESCSPSERISKDSRLLYRVHKLTFSAFLHFY